MSNNKITTYLLYAVGEITLVVVGILIAVGIDNWNQSQKEKESSKLILNGIRKELAEAKKDLEFFLDFRLKYENDLREYVNQINYSKLSTKEKAAIPFPSIHGMEFTYTASYLIGILSSDQSDLIKNIDLKSRLSDWNTNLNSLKTLTIANPDLWHYLDKRIPKIMADGSNLKDWVPLKMEDEETLAKYRENFVNDLEYHNHLKTSINKQFLKRILLNKIIRNTEENINMIETELKK